jgi:hypothetical protein
MYFWVNLAVALNILFRNFTRLMDGAGLLSCLIVLIAEWRRPGWIRKAQKDQQQV